MESSIHELKFGDKSYPPPKNFHGVIEWPRPIPVSERLPEDLEECVLVFARGCWFVSFQVNGSWFGFHHDSREGNPELQGVTHWLPLPPAP